MARTMGGLNERDTSSLSPPPRSARDVQTDVHSNLAPCKWLMQLAHHDRYTADHCHRVAAFTELLAEDLNVLSPSARQNLTIAALLHDVGKIETPMGILHKPGRLSEPEWAIMKAHSLAGVRMVAGFPAPVRQIIAQHHERPDGNGYPFGLRGNAICIEARIVAVADAFDAMTSSRPYRKALAPEEALSRLQAAAGQARVVSSLPGQFDRSVVRAMENRFDDARAVCLATQKRPQCTDRGRSHQGVDPHPARRV